MADDAATPTDLPEDEGGTMHYGGTADAYAGMEDDSQGDDADVANRIDRTDMDGFDEDPPRPAMNHEPDPAPPTRPGDNSSF